MLVYGPGPGLGKSTLGRALTGRLVEQGYSACFFEEHEVTAHLAFRDYVQSVEAGRAGDTATLVEACRRFVARLRDRRPEIAVLDSLLPCWDWLYSAGCSDAEVSNFSLMLAEALSPPRPVLVYVDGDLDAAMSRAVEERGIDWALDLCDSRTGMRDLDALGAYFLRLRTGAEQMLALWPHPVIRVDTVTRDLRSCVDQVVSAVEFRYVE